MVVLSRSFTILASLSTLAAVSVLPGSVSGAPTPARANHHPSNGRNHGTNGSPSHSPNAHGQDATPVGMQSVGGLLGPLSGASSGLPNIGAPSLPLPPRGLDGLAASLEGAAGLPSLPLPPRALRSPHEEAHAEAAEDRARAESRHNFGHNGKV